MKTSDKLPISTEDRNFLEDSENQIKMRRIYIENQNENIASRVQEIEDYLKLALDSEFQKKYWSDDLKKLFMDMVTTTPGVDGDISQVKVFEYMDSREKFIILHSKEEKIFLGQARK